MSDIIAKFRNSESLFSPTITGDFWKNAALDENDLASGNASGKLSTVIRFSSVSLMLIIRAAK